MAGNRWLDRFSRRRNRGAEIAAPDQLDARTLAMLEPGRREFHAQQPEGTRALRIDVDPGESEEAEPLDSITIDATSDARLGIAPAHAIAWSAHHVRPGGWVCIEIPNATVAALDGLHAGVTVDDLLAAIAMTGLDVAEAYGIGYVPQSLLAGERFNAELARNPGVYATPRECVLLAYRCRKPVDASA